LTLLAELQEEQLAMLNHHYYFGKLKPEYTVNNVMFYGISARDTSTTLT